MNVDFSLVDLTSGKTWCALRRPAVITCKVAYKKPKQDFSVRLPWCQDNLRPLRIFLDLCVMKSSIGMETSNIMNECRVCDSRPA